MARARSLEKRQAILDATVREIARSGLGASTANIARAAALAEGTLFTYFPSKEALFNELYLELKKEPAQRMIKDFPRGKSLKHRVRHIWMAYLGWALERPDERKVSRLLHFSSVVSPEVRAQANQGEVENTIAEVTTTPGFVGLPSDFAHKAMASMMEAVLETASATDVQHPDLTNHAFEAFWMITRRRP